MTGQADSHPSLNDIDVGPEGEAEGGAGMTRDRFPISFFPDKTGSNIRQEEVSLAELGQLVLTTKSDDKYDLPLIKLARFGDKPTEKGSLRNDANVVSISGVEGDYDDKQLAFDAAVSRVRDARLRALIYTSPSYTEAEPKWRVILPTSQDLSPSERAKLTARINGVLGGVLAGESFTLSQAYFYGSVNGNPCPQIEITDGDFIDLRDDLDATARGKKQAAGKKQASGKAEGEQRAADDGLPPITSLADDRLAAVAPDVIEIIRTGKLPTDMKAGHAHFKVVAELVRAGFSDSNIKQVYRLSPLGAYVDQSGRGFDGYLDKTIKAARDHSDPKLFEMNEKFCVMPIGGKTRVVTWGKDEMFPGYETIVMSSSIGDFTALHDKYRHSYETKNEDGEVETVTVRLGTWWINQPHRRQYDGGMKFMPRRDEPVVGNTMNLWHGFAVRPRKPEGKSGASGCQLLLDHGLKVICSGDEAHYNYLIKREALIAQQRVRSEIAVALSTEEEGTGKGFWCRSINHIYGTHAMQVGRAEHVIGKHNEHLEKLLRLTADEALFVGNPLHRDALFGLITEPTNTIEPKFIGAYKAENHLNIDILSNAKHFIPVSRTARRFFAPTVSPNYANDHEYFRKIDEQLNDGGYEALAYHLLHEIDIRDFNVRTVPRTAALAEQAAYSRRGIDLLVETVCNERRAPCAFKNHSDFSDTSGYEERRGFDYFIDHHSDRQLASMKALTVKRRLVKDWGCSTGKLARRSINGVQKTGVLWPPLAELREKFEKKHGRQQWTDDDTDWDDAF